jgi:hypothetical protein
LALQPNRVFLCSGHMIDAPGRSEPRFPPDKEGAVRLKIVEQLGRWKAGASDAAVCAGACGADILFAEACLERGARVLLLIPLPEAEFVERSVAFADADWEARYHALRAKCDTRFQHEVLGPPAAGEDPFARNNAWCLDTARSLVRPERVHAILVWDGKSGGDGPGGTADFAARVAASGAVALIDPTKL